MVTGATDGIGLGNDATIGSYVGYAKRLAARGINVILVSRSQEKLHNCAKEITEKYNVRIVYVYYLFRSVSVLLPLT